MDKEYLEYDHCWDAEIPSVSRPLTVNEALQQLQELTKDGIDFEWGHKVADNILLRVINDPAVTETFKQIGRWYS